MCCNVQAKALTSRSQYLVDRKVREEDNVIALTRLVSRSQLRRYRQIPAMNSELWHSRCNCLSALSFHFPLKTSRIADCLAKPRLGHPLASGSKRETEITNDLRIEICKFR